MVGDIIERGGRYPRDHVDFSIFQLGLIAAEGSDLTAHSSQLTRVLTDDAFVCFDHTCLPRLDGHACLCSCYEQYVRI